MRAALVRITLAVALCLGAASCGDDSPAPKPYAGPSTSATPSGAPTLPVEAKGTTDAAKIAATKHYLAVLSYASGTGDTTSLDTLSRPGCTSCDGTRRSIHEIYAAGGRVEGRGFGLEDARVEPRRIKGDPVVRGVIVAYAQKTVRSKGASPTYAKVARVEARFLLSRESDHWLIKQWTRES